MESDRIDDSVYNQDDSSFMYQQQAQQQAQQPPNVHYYQPAPPMPAVSSEPTKKSFLEDLDKNVYIIIFVAFILGFFMGKTMQPVILRQ
jgi:hypothetical protein